MTTIVVAHTSRREGHVTRPSSLRTSVRNLRPRPNQPKAWLEPSGHSNIAIFIAPSLTFERRPVRPHIPILTATARRFSGARPYAPHLAGQEGIEPPALGFGDRCSAN